MTRLRNMSVGTEIYCASVIQGTVLGGLDPLLFIERRLGYLVGRSGLICRIEILMYANLCGKTGGSLGRVMAG